MQDKKPILAGTDSARVNVARELESVSRSIADVYGEELWTAIKTGMAIVASLSFEGVSTPISLLYEGGSGRGKSTIINILDPDRDETKARIYRLDKFTPRSFVTHAANVSQEDLKEIDLLPKLKDRVLLSKELAPLFRGRDDELRENFATLAAVLDGKGFITSSGVHGTRGYDERCVFNWLGATTPVPARTDAIMAQLGNRLLRYEIVGAEPTDDELLEFAASYDPIDREEVCRKAVNDFLERHFARCPLRSIDRQAVAIPKPLLKEMVHLCNLVAHGRVEVKQCAENGLISETEFIPGIPEGPQRIILYVRTIAQALALLVGRKEVISEDVMIIRHIAFSSVPNTRRDTLRALLLAGGKVDTADVETGLGVSKPTARLRMRELAATGIVNWHDSKGSAGAEITLAGKWDWLMQESTEQAGMTEAPAETKVPLWVCSQPFRLGSLS
jgi:hypothetical protein